mgnify:CR=1 FL=1
MMTELTLPESNLIDKVNREPELESYFFKKIKKLKWFSSLESAGFFSTDEMPAIIQNANGSYRYPSWPAIDYLVKSSAYLTESPDLIPNFLAIIHAVTFKDVEAKYSNTHLLWNFSKIYRNIPFAKLSIEDIALVNHWFSDIPHYDMVSDDVAQCLVQALEAYLPAFEENSLAILSILFDVKAGKSGVAGRPEPHINLKSHRKEELIIKLGQLVGRILERKGIDLLLEKLAEVIEVRGGDEYSNIWRSAIEEHEQNGSVRDTEDLLVVICREALLSYSEIMNKEELNSLFDQLLDHPLAIVKRLAIYTYHRYFDKTGNIPFSKVLKTEFFKSNYQHEFWHLLNCHYCGFSKEQKVELVRIIQEEIVRADGTPSYYVKAQWLAAIKDHDAILKADYDVLVEKLGTAPEHPSFASFSSSVRMGSSESPIPLEKLKESAEVSAKNLVFMLNGFKPKKDIFAPDVDDLARCFRSYVIDDADKVAENLEAYKELKLPFIYELIQAYLELWRDGEKPQPDWGLAWPSLLKFIGDMFASDDFWLEDKAEKEVFSGRCAWFVAVACRLIEAGCKNDTHAFDIANIEAARKIITQVLDNQRASDFTAEDDAVSISINSARGQCIEALINLALFDCRQEEKVLQKHDDAWARYEDIFSAEAVKENNYEFYTLIPMYFNNLKWLSKDWMRNSFSLLFKNELDIACLCALQGYAMNNYLEPLMYQYLKGDGVYEAILDSSFLKKTERQFITFGLIWYIFENEDIAAEASLIFRLLSRNKPDEIREVISKFRFFFSGTDNIKEKAIEIFPILLKQTNKEKLEGKKVLSSLVDWAKFLDANNESHKKWLVEIAPYAEIDNNANDFIETIESVSAVNPAYALEIWSAMLTTTPSYPYPEESYINIYKNLIAAKLEREAVGIADTYIKYGLQEPAEWFRYAKQGS